MQIYLFRNSSTISILSPESCSAASATLSLLGDYTLTLTTSIKLDIGTQIVASVDGLYYEFIVATSSEQWKNDTFIGQYSCVPSCVWELSKTPINPGYIGSYDGTQTVDVATALLAAIPTTSRWSRAVATDISITTTGNILFDDYTTSWELLKKIASVYGIGYKPTIIFNATTGKVTSRTLRAFNAEPTTFENITVFQNNTNIKELRVQTQGANVVSKISGLGAVTSTDPTTGVKERIASSTSYTTPGYALEKTDGTLWYPEARLIKDDTSTVATLNAWLYRQRATYFTPREEITLRVSREYRYLRIGNGANVAGFSAPFIGTSSSKTYTGMISKLKYDLLHEDALIEVTVGSEYKYSI